MPRIKSGGTWQQVMELSTRLPSFPVAAASQVFQDAHRRVPRLRAGGQLCNTVCPPAQHRGRQQRQGAVLRALDLQLPR